MLYLPGIYLIHSETELDKRTISEGISDFIHVDVY